MKVPFHRPFFGEREAEAAREAVMSCQVVGGGPKMKRVEELLEGRFRVPHFLATTSCTHALELAMMTAGIGPGDEVIIPTYTFASTATAALRQRARVVFCDVNTTDLNINIDDAAGRITAKTKAIVPVHYAGLPCDMEKIQELAAQHDLVIIEDAAQGFDTVYKNRALGTWGDFGCYSFHGTKSVACGEGGGLAISQDAAAKRAEILREKGTDRAQFLRGEIDKYTWRDEGSSFIPSDILMAVLDVQLEKMDEIKARRGRCVRRYQEGLAGLEASGKLSLPQVPEGTDWNFHIFYILLPGESERETVLGELQGAGIQALRHYYPLDTSPLGKTLRADGEKELPGAQEVTARLLRLPLYTAMPEEEVDYVVQTLQGLLS